MRIIDADDLYQKCIEIQLKKRNRYFDIDDVIKLIKKAPTVDVLDKIHFDVFKLCPLSTEGECIINAVLQIIDKYKERSE